MCFKFQSAFFFAIETLEDESMQGISTCLERFGHNFYVRRVLNPALYSKLTFSRREKFGTPQVPRGHELWLLGFTILENRAVTVLELIGGEDLFIMYICAPGGNSSDLHRARAFFVGLSQHPGRDKLVLAKTDMWCEKVLAKLSGETYFWNRLPFLTIGFPHQPAEDTRGCRVESPSSAKGLFSNKEQLRRRAAELCSLELASRAQTIHRVLFYGSI